MFGKSLRARIGFTYATLIIACVGALSIYLILVAQNSYLTTLRQKVDGQAMLLGEAVRPFFTSPVQQEQIDEIAKKLGPEIDSRVTVIDSTGQVLGDSEEDPAAMENHRNRPEVMAALKGISGADQRLSATVGYDTLYVAEPIIGDNGKVIGVARIALPISHINQTSEQIARTSAIGGLVAIILAMALALLIVKSTTDPIRDLTMIASKMADGELDQRIRSYSDNEVGRLSRVFDQMADRLQDMIKTISTERNNFATVLSTMADGTVIVDKQGKVVLANRAAGRLLRIPTSSMEGKSYVEVLRDHELSAVLQKCLAQGVQQSGTIDLGPDRRFLRIIATPIRDEQGGALALLQDLTEVRRVETVRRDFIANVSHELRTPLASLKALVETLEDGAVEEPEVARDFLSKMHQEVDGLTQLVGELLELTRIESGQAALHVEPVEVTAIVDAVVDRLSPQIERAGLRLSIQLPEPFPRLQVDRQRVQQVLTNLLHNAVKFTPQSGEITVAAREEDGWAVISVADTGVGIASEDLSRIFERFYKADRSRAGGGTGLGLAIAKHVVQAHGGRIWAESVEGRGSTFFFTLPFVGSEP